MNEQKINSEQKYEITSVAPDGSNAVGMPCEICGEIVIVEKGIVSEEECDMPTVCGKCYTEYYYDYFQSLRTGYNI